MVIIKLLGGLGNQMFEYAFGRNLTLKNQTALKLDEGGLTYKDSTPRHFSLDCFNIQATIASAEEIKKTKKEPPSKFLKKIKRALKIKKILPAQNYLKEVDFTPEESLNLKGNLYLEGFFQKEEYFKTITETIRKDFTLKKSLEDFNPELQKKICNCNSVAVHIRRKDYLSNPEYNKTHGSLPLFYYQDALKLISSKIQDPFFFIFSDDKKWCEENLFLSEKMFFVEGQKDYEDLILMSYCQHQIIANSSFSWWGAWLNENPNKIVIAPKQWFTGKELNEQTIALIPENWIRI